MNQGTLTPVQVTFCPLMFALSQPFCPTVPSMVAERPWPPTSFAVMAKVLAVGLTVPVAWAIDFMLSHEIMPDSVLPAPTTMCQSKHRLLTRLGGLVVVVTGVILAALRYWPLAHGG